MVQYGSGASECKLNCCGFSGKQMRHEWLNLGVFKIGVRTAERSAGRDIFGVECKGEFKCLGAAEQNGSLVDGKEWIEGQKLEQDVGRRIQEKVRVLLTTIINISLSIFQN